MNARRFDDFSRKLGAAGSRRGFLRVLAGAVAGAFAGLLRAEPSKAAAMCLQDGALCSTNSSCCSGFCDGATPFRPGGCATSTTSSGSGGSSTPTSQCGRATLPCCPGNVCYDGTACSGGSNPTCGSTIVCPGGCPAGTACCTGGCATLSSDIKNCGTCGRACPTPLNGFPTCTNGVCGIACNSGFSNCGNGCCATGQCANTTCCTAGTSPCGVGASAVCCGANGSSCQSGVCCAANLTNCSGLCVNEQTDLLHCGSCSACPVPANSTAACTNGVCSFTCISGFSLCSGACVNLQADSHNCGTCGHVCATGAICLSGQCMCGLSDQIVCNNVCVSHLMDSNNCGSCGNVCTGGQFCQNGQCVCPFEQAVCSGICVSLDFDPNCGGCGVSCSTVCAPRPGICSQGICACD